MKTLTKMLVLGLVSASVSAGVSASSADAKGFHSGHGHHHAGGRFVRFGFNHDYCWKFGKWVCGQHGY